MNEKQQIETILNGLIKRRGAVEKQLSLYPAGELKVRKQIKNEKEYVTLYLEKEPEKQKNRNSGENRSKEENRNSVRNRNKVENRKTRTSITSNKPLVKTMARKRYLQSALEMINNDIEILQNALEIIDNTDPDSILSALDPEIRKNIVFQKMNRYRMPEDPALAKELLTWIQTPYPKNMRHPEHLKHRASTGELMRSKSEVLVFEKLKEFGIAAKYEFPFAIGDTVLYPDFTIMRTDGKIFYWEHAGRCDLPQYRDEIMWKISMYAGVGIGQWDNLIITYDTGDGEIDLREIESVITNKLLLE